MAAQVHGEEQVLPAAAEQEQQVEQEIEQLDYNTDAGSDGDATEGPASEQQVASLDAPQLVDYSANTIDMNLMPQITTLIMHITHHLSSPDGNAQLALTFQPLVNMALNLQLQVQASLAPDPSAMSYLSSALAAGNAMHAGAAAAAQELDPHALMAAATAQAAEAAGADTQAAGPAAEGVQPADQQQEQQLGVELQEQQLAEQQQQQVQQIGKSSSGGGAGRRRQQAQADEEGWRQTVQQQPPQRGTAGRPQRQRKKSRLLQEYVDGELLERDG